MAGHGGLHSWKCPTERERERRGEGEGSVTLPMAGWLGLHLGVEIASEHG